MSGRADPNAVLTIGVGAISSELLATLLGLGATVTPNLDEPLAIELNRPIDGPAGPITQFVIREPSAGELMQWDKLVGVEADVKAIAVVAGIPVSVVEKLPARAFYLAARRIGAFLS